MTSCCDSSYSGLPSSARERKFGSPKCAWQNQRLHSSQYLVAGIMHGLSQREMPGQNTVVGSLSCLAMGMPSSDLFSSRPHEGHVEQVRCAGMLPKTT